MNFSKFKCLLVYQFVIVVRHSFIFSGFLLFLNRVYKCLSVCVCLYIIHPHIPAHSSLVGNHTERDTGASHTHSRIVSSTFRLLSCLCDLTPLIKDYTAHTHWHPAWEVSWFFLFFFIPSLWHAISIEFSFCSEFHVFSSEHRPQFLFVAVVVLFSSAIYSQGISILKVHSTDLKSRGGRLQRKFIYIEPLLFLFRYKKEGEGGLPTSFGLLHLYTTIISSFLFLCAWNDKLNWVVILLFTSRHWQRFTT